MGAGDVKLVGALGAWLGPGETFWMAMYTAIAGGVMALMVSAWQGYLRQAWSNVWLLLTHWRVSGPQAVPGVDAVPAAARAWPMRCRFWLERLALVWLR